MKKNIGSALALYPTPVVVVGAMNGEKPTWTLAAHVDFFSIGTNDLTQYTLALDRQNSKAGRFYDPHHPAVLELIRISAKAAHEGGAWCGICGELAADLSLTEQFLDWGIDELSVSPGGILPLKETIRSLP